MVLISRSTPVKTRPRYARWVLVVLVLIAPAALAQTYTKLRDLGTQSGDPLNPAWVGIFAQGRDGNLYSTTQGGGANALGAVFRLTPSGTMTRLYSFANGNDGAFPNSGLTLGTDGSLYGTAVAGGLGFGTVFKITASGTFTPLHSFNGNAWRWNRQPGSDLQDDPSRSSHGNPPFSPARRTGVFPVLRPGTGNGWQVVRNDHRALTRAALSGHDHRRRHTQLHGNGRPEPSALPVPAQVELSSGTRPPAASGPSAALRAGFSTASTWASARSSAS